MSNNLTSAGSSNSSPTPPWIQLPANVMAQAEIMASAESVCTTWRRVCWQPSLWRVIDMKNFQQYFRKYGDNDILCRLAVDCSQGELIDINIEYFGDDDLLRYISDRSSQLKRMRLVLSNATGHGLTTAVKNFPLLEEIHLISMQVIGAIGIESISISSPMLKSFSFDNPGHTHLFLGANDSTALSIAKNMPGLRHLSLFGNRLSNEGLEAILNCCTQLESLDLRQCFHVDLQSDLGRRCSEQIKELRCPLDSTADNEWYDEIYDSDDDSDY